MSHYNYVVIGGGIAGVSCTEQLILEDPESTVCLVTLSSFVKTINDVTHVTQIIQSFTVSEKYYKDYTDHKQLTIKFQKAISIEDHLHRLICEDNSIISYDKVCVCTGGIPRLQYPKHPLILGLRDTTSIKSFAQKLSKSRQIVIIGNGGIANELVYEISNCNIIWCIKDKSLNAAFFEEDAGNFLLHHVNRKREYSLKHTRFATSNSIETTETGCALGPDWKTDFSLEGNSASESLVLEKECLVIDISCNEQSSEWPLTVKLSNGKNYQCDFVVSATGVTPLTDCVSATLNRGPDGGLLINDQMQTSATDVYAAGDVCSPNWQLSPLWFQMRLWTQARQMGMYAAHCMATNKKGEAALLDISFELFTHSTNFFGFKIVLLGLYNNQNIPKEECEILVRCTPSVEYIKVILRNSRMQGAILIGETDLEETFENLILNQLDISHVKDSLLDPNIDIDDYFD